MKVVVVVRMVADYRSFTNETFGDQLEQPYKPRTELQILMANDVLGIWDRTFRMGYIEYRHRMAEIAKQNHADTGCLVLRGHEAFSRWYTESDEDAIIVPVDDDDWLSPTLADVAKEFEPKTQVVVWKTTVLHSLTKHFYGVSEGFKLNSNNWAIRKSLLKRFDDKTARHTVLLSHFHADNFIKKHVGDGLKRLQSRHSVYNRHLASLSFLRQKLTEEDITLELPKVVRRPMDFSASPEDCVWCSPYARRLYWLNLSIRQLFVPHL